jgi:EAL domain-containing protein (putative c-di-GMP-specific phosphodiesterase class I)/GGDEF domain-containing protein
VKVNKSITRTALFLVAAFDVCAIASVLLVGLGLAPKGFAIPLGLLLFVLACAMMAWMWQKMLVPMLRISSSAQAVLLNQTSDIESLVLPDEFALAEIALREAADPPRFISKLVEPAQAASDSTRDRFERELVHLVDRCKRRKEGAVLALVRIRFYDRISAAFGAEAAEQYAEAMTARLSSLYVAPTRVFRYERNVLAIVKIGILPDGFDGESEAIAATAIQAFQAPVRWREQALSSEAHIALAAYPRDADSASALQRAAAAALETIGNNAPSGKIQATDSSAREAREQMQMAERVRTAIATGEFEPYFQPVVNLRERRVEAVELLARWPGTNGRMTEPGKFLPVAEDTNQVTQLSNLLFMKAGQSMKAWRAHGIRIPVAVNVSGSMINPGLPAIVTTIMQRTGLPPELLEIEITETAIFHKPQEAEAVLRELSALGLSLSLDDFGTGYSSLSYLLKLPISKIKIDQSFTSRVMTDPVSLSIIRATISLADSLGHAVVAEGVSDREISTRLLELGCHLQQGFGFSPGLPSSDALQWITRWEASSQHTEAL